MSSKELQPSAAHSVFASEVMGVLLNNVELKKLEASKYVYCGPDIADAIFFINNIFKADFEKVLSQVRSSLKDVELFKEYCEVIPVEKDNCYFYHYLKRISLIFKMALFCYENSRKNFKYFDMARLCIGNCPDTQYFQSKGGFQDLNDTASFIARIAQPQKLIMPYCRDENVLTFVNSVEKLRSDYVHSGNVKMLDSKEMNCLFRLKDLFEKKVTKATSNKNLRNTQSCNVEMQELLESGKQVLMDYVLQCLKEARGDYQKSKERKAESPSKVKDFVDKTLSEIEAGGTVACISTVCSERNVDDNIPHKSVKTNDNALENCDDEYSPEYLSTSFTASCSPISPTEVESQVLSFSFSDLCIAPRKAMKDEASSPSDPSEVLKSSPIQNFENNTDETKSDVKLDFVVPQAYMACVRTMHKREHLYVSKMDPPSNREKLDESLKAIIDAKVSSKNYRELINGDIFVSSPDSTHEREVVVIFVDSSSDKDIEEDTYKLICRFKKIDIAYEDKGISLRPRKHKNSISTVKKTENSDCNSPTVQSSETDIMNASTSSDYMKYLLCLYKRYLPDFLMKLLETLSERPIEAVPCNPSNLIFIMTASMLANRKVELLESLKKKNLRCLILFTYETRGLNWMEEKQLDIYIEKALYHPINSDASVYLVGSKCFDRAEFSKVICFALFPAITAERFSNHPNRRKLKQILNLYEVAMLSWIEMPDIYYFNHVRRDIDNIILY